MQRFPGLHKYTMATFSLATGMLLPISILFHMKTIAPHYLSKQDCFDRVMCDVTETEGEVWKTFTDQKISARNVRNDIWHFAAALWVTSSQSPAFTPLGSCVIVVVFLLSLSEVKAGNRRCLVKRSLVTLLSDSKRRERMLSPLPPWLKKGKHVQYKWWWSQDRKK